MLDINILAAWGEFIGGIAVVVSLIYLAGQIRQNSKLLRASTASVSLQASAAVSTLCAQDPDLSRLYFAGMAELSEADKARFDHLLGLYFTGDQQQFRLAGDGSLSSEVWEDQEQSHRWIMQQPGAKDWWGQWRNLYGRDFQVMCDGLIREGEAAE
jgi:hypothetical protein